MNEGGQRDPLRFAPVFAPLFAVAFLGLTLLTRLGNAAYWSGPAGAAVLAGLFALPLLYAVPRYRALWVRRRGWLLATQAVLTYAPLAVFGQAWINAGAGLLIGLLLLTVAAPRSWFLFGAVIAAEAVRIAVLGIPWEGPKGAFFTWMLVAPVTTGMAFFGLVRLTDMVAALTEARTELADLAVARERRWSAERLREAIGDNLEVVTARARAALAALPGNPDRARAQLTESAASARLALEQVRTAVAADLPRPLPQTHSQAEPGPGRRGAVGERVAPRLARSTLVVVLAGQSAILTSNILVAGGAGFAKAGALGTIVVLVALQLYQSFGWRAGERPRAWKLTLAAQLLLALAWLPAYDWNVLTLAGLAAGSALLLLPRRWAWPAFGAVVAGVGVGWSLPVLGVYYGLGNRSVFTVAADNATVLYQMGAVATAGIVVFGLSRLTGLAEQVEATRRALARAAVERERLRVAQDTHDLLGLGLSVVALKSDLAGRLIDRDPADNYARARGELALLLRAAGQARADLRAVAVGESEVSLRAELDVAREVLASAGVDVEVRTNVRAEPLDPPLPAQVDAMLATVLREAVTNLLRHAEATRCEIDLTAGEGDVRLLVANDGVADGGGGSGGGERRAGGRGLTNLSTRAAAAGGQLSVRADGERFELTVRAPLDRSAAGGEDVLATGDPPYGVQQRIRGTVLDEEP